MCKDRIIKKSNFQFISKNFFCLFKVMSTTTICWHFVPAMSMCVLMC